MWGSEGEADSGEATKDSRHHAGVPAILETVSVKRAKMSIATRRHVCVISETVSVE